MTLTELKYIVAVALLKAIHALLELKRNASALGLSPQIPGNHVFVEGELERLESVLSARVDRLEVVPQLPDLCRQVWCEAWSNPLPGQPASREAF